MSSFAVVGGGVCGLACAHYLRKMVPAAKRIVVFESSDRVGGWVRTTRYSDGGVRHHEHGPRTVRPVGAKGANTLALAQELGLAQQVVPISREHPTAQNRFILVDGRLHRLPSTLWSLFRPLPPFRRPLFLAGLRDLLTTAEKADDLSLFDFVEDRFGADVARLAVDPMVRGICAGDARKISAKSFVAGPLFEMAQKDGSVLRSVIKDFFRPSEKIEEPNCELVIRARREKWSVWTLKNGLETLIETLEARLDADDSVEIVKNFELEDMRPGKNMSVVLSGGDVDDEFDGGVVMAAPAFAAAEAVRNVSQKASRLLSDIPYVTVVTATVEFDEKVCDVDAFGFLVPSDQPEKILGVIYDSCSFPEVANGRQVFTVMAGGAWHDAHLGGLGEDEAGAAAADELRKALGISAAPSRVTTRTMPDCIAQYTVGHAARVAGARAELEPAGVGLAGSAYDGVGVNDAVMSARVQAARMARLAGAEF